MAAAGEVIRVYFRRSQADFTPAPGLVVGDFLFYINGAAVVPTAFGEVGQVGASWTEYYADVQMPGPGSEFLDLFIEQASGTDVISPDTFTDDIQVYDNDALAALQLTAVGSVTVAGSASDSDYGDVVENDSWRPATQTVEIPASKLAPFGYTDLTDVGWTISGALKDGPSGTSVLFPITTIVDGANRLVEFGWDAFPAGLALDAGEETRTWSFDIQLKNGATTITGLRGTLRVKWERDS
jgi:hypothetical protein